MPGRGAEDHALHLNRGPGQAPQRGSRPPAWTASAGARTAYNPFESTITAANVAGLGAAWTATVPGGAAFEPVAVGGVAYVRSPGTLTKLDLATGAIDWSTGSLGGIAVPTLVGGGVYVPISGTTCAIVTLDPGTSAVVGQSHIGPPELTGGQPAGVFTCVPGDALGFGSKVVVPWHFYGFAQHWPACEPSPVGLFWTDQSGVQAVDAATTTTWRTAPEGMSACDTQPTPQPTFGSAALFGSSYLTVRYAPGTGTVVAFPASNCQDCSPAWTTGTGVIGTPLVTHTGDIAETAGNQIDVFDGATHAIKWTGTSAAFLDRLAATSTTIFASTNNGTLAAFPLGGCGSAYCSPAWTATTGSGTSNTYVSIGGDVVYVTAEGGTVTAFPANGCGASTCAALWSHATGALIHTAPVIVTSDDGTVTAFALPTP